jgi:hypothetical protein
MGWIVSTYGVHVGMLVSGGVPALAALTASIVLARRGHLKLQVRVKHHVPMVHIEHRLAA